MRLLTLTILAAAAVNAVADDAAARRAFSEAAPVFQHPRCMNCHPVGDRPLQGDQSRPHAMNVQRGPDGNGRAGMRCSDCHNPENLHGARLPPGAPNWHLTPPEMPMVFEKMSAGELCRQLKDPAKNGGKTVAQIVEHATRDKLVLWGWNPGEGRTPVSIPHAEFAQSMQEWEKNGAACPE